MKELDNLRKEIKRCRSADNITEEATKQWLILPVISLLGYDIKSSEVIPEYTLDVGVKKGEKVDYLININNKPSMIIECKRVDVGLGDKNISQLYRYFSVADVKLAVLTNGIEYWLFTDSKRENIMDTEPFEKINIMDKSAYKIELMSKGFLRQGVSKIREYIRYKNGCKVFSETIKSGDIPMWIINSVLEESDAIDLEINPTALRECLMDELFNRKYHSFNVSSDRVLDTANRVVSSSRNQDNKIRADGQAISNIKLNHEYVFNDYRDGDWLYHKIDYAIVFGKRYDKINGRQLLLVVIQNLLDSGVIDREDLLNCSEFKTIHKIDTIGGYRDARYIEKYDLYVNTGFSILQIVTFIEKLLRLANAEFSGIKLSFKS